MIINEQDSIQMTILGTARLMVTAAKTAPKGRGADNLELKIVDGEEKQRIADEMKRIAEKTGSAFYTRDAAGVENATALVLIGTHNSPIGLPGCGLCGFKDCAGAKEAGANCVFNITDLGIALGSAVWVAKDHCIDNRIMTTAGRAAMKAGLFSEDVKVAYAILLSATSKNIFYDRMG